MIKKILITLIFLIINITVNAEEKVTLQLDWLNQFQFAGYYIAKEKGYYKDNNLDVEIKEYTNDTNIIENTLKNNGNYAIGKSSLVLDKKEGKDIILLSSIFQNSPLILITTKKSKIKNIKDLKNKRVMITNDAKSTASIIAMIVSNGLNIDDIVIQNHSFNLNDLIDGKTDAMACYLSNEPFTLKNKNIEFNILNPKDYGFDFYEGILFTSKDELTNHPKRVKNFKEASLKGWNYAFNNIEETAKIIYKKYNTQNKSLEALIYEGKILKDLAKFDKNLLGSITLNKIKEVERIYSLLGFKSKNKSSLENLIYDIKTLDLTDEEKKYLKNNQITFLTNSNYKPFTMEINNKLSGIEIEFMRLIEEKLNIKLNIKIEENNNTRLEMIEKDKNSFKYLISTLDKQENKFINTQAVSKYKVAIATLNDKAFIENIKDLKNKSIAISKYSTLNEELKKFYPNINLIETKDIRESFNLLSQNKVFGVISKLPILTYYINSEGLTNMKISGTFPETFKMKFILNKNNDILKNILNKTINQINDEDKFRINSKFNLVKYEGYVDYSWVYKVSIPLILVIILILIINNKLSKEIEKRKKIEKALYEIANKDSLTKIYNRRKIEEIYTNEINRAKRYETTFSIIFFDIDDFKNINDTFGHHMGDDILIQITNLIKNNLRKTDYFGRWGGDEFLIVLAETSYEDALYVVKILEEKLKSNDYKIKNFPSISCSFGICEYKKYDTFDSLLTKADDEMYKLKKEKKL